jgi:hypothetical protein
MTCPRCGATYLAADPECPRCGLAFPTAVANATRIESGPPRTTRDSERPWLLRGASVVGVLLGAFLVLHYIGPSSDGGISTWDPSDIPDLGASADSSPSTGTLPSLGADGLPTADNLAASGSITADQTAKPGKDGAGRRTTYEAGNLVDKDLRTAWRVQSFGQGHTITIALPAKSRIQVVGLTNGYTKVDDASGEDLYTSERRIITVTWVFDNGTSVNQTLQDPDRSLQLLRIPAVEAQSVKLEIGTTTNPGRIFEDYTAITEVFLGTG